MSEFRPLIVGRWSKATVRTISNRLKHIRNVNGVLTREVVLEDARSEASPLHGYFDWNDDTAAEKWRLQQAGEIIRACRVSVTISGVDQPMRQFVRVVDEGVAQYETLDEVRADDELSQQVVQRAQDDLKAWLARYQHIKEFFSSLVKVKSAIEELAKSTLRTKPRKVVIRRRRRAG